MHHCTIFLRCGKKVGGIACVCRFFKFAMAAGSSALLCFALLCFAIYVRFFSSCQHRSRWLSRPSILTYITSTDTTKLLGSSVDTRPHCAHLSYLLLIVTSLRHFFCLLFRFGSFCSFKQNETKQNKTQRNTREGRWRSRPSSPSKSGTDRACRPSRSASSPSTPTSSSPRTSSAARSRRARPQKSLRRYRELLRNVYLL